jgi:uncharacterized protein
MGKIESYAPGSFCWAELATNDAVAAKKLYGELFGWTANDVPSPGGVYTMFQANGLDAAAMYGARAGVPPHWNVYFSVANADQAAAKAEQLGGKLLGPPFDVMDFGRMTTVTDPQGASFCIWQPGKHIGATYPGPLNQMCWAELMSRDAEGSAAFYGGLFGWKTKPAQGLAAAEYVEWVVSGKSTGGMLPMKGEKFNGVPPNWGVYISVADCDERAAKAKALGAQICVPPTDVANAGRFAVLVDGQGATFNIIHLTGMV